MERRAVDDGARPDPETHAGEEPQMRDDHRPPERHEEPSGGDRQRGDAGGGQLGEDALEKVTQGIHQVADKVKGLLRSDR
jgi:hypothetical protein